MFRPRRVSGTLFLLVVGCAGSARASEPTLEEAVREFEALDYARAIQTAQQVIARGRNGPAELRRLYELLGSASAIVGHDAGTREFFQRLIALHPDYALPKHSSPKIAGPFARVRAGWGRRPGLTISHVAPREARCDQPLALRMTIVADELRLVRTARVVYSLPGGLEERRELVPRGDTVVLDITPPSGGAAPGTLRYRLELLDKHGNVLTAAGTSTAPLTLHLPATDAPRPMVRGTPWYRRWWVWTIAGVIVGGATAAAVIASRKSSEDLSDVHVAWSVKALRW